MHHLTSELEQVRRTADERGDAHAKLQAQLDELRASTNQGPSSLLPNANAGADDSWKVVREELGRQAEYLRSLESKNAKMSAELSGLRERHASIEVLREKNRELERKARVAEELRTKVVSLEAELEAARKEREEW